MREVDKVIERSREHMEVFALEFGKWIETSFIMLVSFNVFVNEFVSWKCIPHTPIRLQQYKRV